MALIFHSTFARPFSCLSNLGPTPSATLHARKGYCVAMYTRSYRHLTADERENLNLGLASGYSLRSMARILGCALEYGEPRVGPEH